jgi:hypothetical protein
VPVSDIKYKTLCTRQRGSISRILSPFHCAVALANLLEVIYSSRVSAHTEQLVPLQPAVLRVESSLSIFNMSVNDYEKGHSAINTTSANHGIGDIVESKGAAIGEAADIYGDVETAQQYGYVERK